MKSVALKVTDKTEILQAIVTNLRKAAKFKLPKQLEEDEAPDINLNQIAKDIAYAKIME